MTRWYQEKKREHYYKKAKQTGYRSRSAFKLKQINNRFDIFSEGIIVVDLGAAPGGWTQVASENIGSNGRIIAVDIVPMKPVANAQIIHGDITTTSTFETLLSVLPKLKADVVLSDMSPNITGTYSVDQARSVWLGTHALSLAEKILVTKGTFVCKLFEGEDTQNFINSIKHSFYIVKKFSPRASRKKSSEIYIIAKTLKKQYKL